MLTGGTADGLGRRSRSVGVKARSWVDKTENSSAVGQNGGTCGDLGWTDSGRAASCSRRSAVALGGK
jgi:hypothetical protein